MDNVTRIAGLISGPALLLAPLADEALPCTMDRWTCPGLMLESSDSGPGLVWAELNDLASVAVPEEVPPFALELRVDKSAVAEGVWQGTISGDATGTLTTVLMERQVDGPIWQVHFAWIVTASDRSFVADLRGTLNNDTGAVVMNGTVVDGYLVGADVHEEGQLVDTDTLRFNGTIRLMVSGALTATDWT